MKKGRLSSLIFSGLPWGRSTGPHTPDTPPSSISESTPGGVFPRILLLHVGLGKRGLKTENLVYLSK